VLQERGGIGRDEMFRAFNMGIGLILVCAPEQAPRVSEMLRAHGESPVALGRISRGDRKVVYESAL
jgi:phosphoribosylformylglycinamidine cyclo-ligase